MARIDILKFTYIELEDRVRTAQ